MLNNLSVNGNICNFEEVNNFINLNVSNMEGINLTISEKLASKADILVMETILFTGISTKAVDSKSFLSYTKELNLIAKSHRFNATFGNKCIMGTPQGIKQSRQLFYKSILEN